MALNLFKKKSKPADDPVSAVGPDEPDEPDEAPEVAAGEPLAFEEIGEGESSEPETVTERPMPSSRGFGSATSTVQRPRRSRTGGARKATPAKARRAARGKARTRTASRARPTRKRAPARKATRRKRTSPKKK